MNQNRILLGGIVAGLVFWVVSLAIDAGLLMERYTRLQASGHMRAEPRLPFMAVYPLVLLGVGVLLVWLYAAARPRLGAGPRTALLVGLAVGLVAGVPGNVAQFSWTYMGGYVSLWWMIEMVAGCALGTLIGAALYKE